MEIITNEYLLLLFIPITIGLVEVIKKVKIMPDRFIPLLSLVLGVTFGIVFSGFELKDGIIAGLQIGLSSVGVYSGTSNVKYGIKDIVNK